MNANAVFPGRFGGLDARPADLAEQVRRTQLALGPRPSNLDSPSVDVPGSEETPDWALRYDGTVTDILTQRDTDALPSAWPDTGDGHGAHPTPDH